MLGKLMKYEFKAVGRIMLPLYGAWIIMSILLGIVLKTASDVETLGAIISIIISLVYAAVTVAVVVLSIILIIQRFYRNLLGNEGYLMLTLPVSESRHIWSKTISATAWVAVGALMGMVSALIINAFLMGWSHSVEAVKFFFTGLWNNLGSEGTLIIIESIVIGLILVAEGVIKVYAAISIGHQWSNHRVLGAIAAYLGLGIVEIILAGIFAKIFGAANFWDKIYDAARGLSDMAAFQLSMLGIVLLSGVMIAIYYFVTHRLLSRRLNLE